MATTTMGHGGMDHTLMDHGGSGHTMDHGMHSMNHGGMDHTMGHEGHGGMDHASSGHGVGYFHFSQHATLLFFEWHTMTWAEMLGSCIAVAVLAALYEGLKVVREYLEVRCSPKSGSASGCECANTDSRSAVTNDSQIAMEEGVKGHNINKITFKKQRPRILRGGHLLQTLMHFIQLWISLSLMLIFMTFNVYLCLAVTLGGAVGYFCFAWMKKRPALYENEVCH